MLTNNMNIRQALIFGKNKLFNKNIKFPHLEAEILLSKSLNKPREYFYTYYEKQLTKNQILKFNRLIARRLRGEPIAYIVGHKEFYGLNFTVNSNTLIPRPETELMIDEIVKHSTKNKKHKNQNISFIDIGTGSGCIVITLAKLLKNKYYTFYATDISTKALVIARKNAHFHQLNKQINFFKGNLIEPIIKNKILTPNSFFIITANLPYLTPKQIKNSPSIKKEPRLALVAGKDGLEYYHQLFKQLRPFSNLNGRLLCEIDTTQKKSISQLIKNDLPGSIFQIKKDLQGHNRLAIISF